METLVQAMATDSAQVAGRIQRLLLPSYFPGPEEGPALVAALLRQSPQAGRAFCQFLAGHQATAGRGASSDKGVQGVYVLRVLE